ncbi:cysteine--tRNA ligase [Leptospira mayottensis]|uniref:Cysteine--tRNA ligase n=2 Tax=Leptospira mayottensis TaxID=1137606 RepID=A0AA87MS18_9LEPT|nr:cysteine--tRNA ligase [Leptospira mayottensis]AXR61110.1 cysteine--tRNA ligase [Leptospira mayottensis]AXR65638.1 cysteine--tRNA ligase [Leptospira mayottensis]AZQ02454.1 cysteine--tRNA ligase [Leptospira mayottensis 200901116]EKS01273.1 cysteine--tRNA ligase [Leptospira mayottensis 200901122]TGM98441.1 cysteine--tRNA ligase [Leptospira mayottensis]
MIEVQFYNSLSGKKEKFSPANPHRVTVYSCGPTVYNFAHIGNLRAFLFVDVLRRSLKLLGYGVDMTMNITDIDDKIIRDSISSQKSIQEFTTPWTEAFFEDLKTVSAEFLEHYPKATESIPEMIEIIQRLRSQGLVYEKDGNLYFSIQKFEGYGKLSKIDTSGMKTGTRYDTDEYEKEDVRDFVLWKSPKLKGEAFWKTPVGTGRPGWHLECSAMIRKIYGSGVDIHTGGVDLLFPHHENEVAQSEGAFPEESFVRTWLHSEHLLVEGQKMSKSKGNFYTLRDLIDQGLDPKAIRFLLISAHYRSKLNFSTDRIAEASANIRKIQNCLDRLFDLEPDVKIDSIFTFTLSLTQTWKKEFEESLADDLNISKALAVVFESLKQINSLLDTNRTDSKQRIEFIQILAYYDRIFGILNFESQKDSLIDSRIDSLIEERQTARKNKDFVRSDAIRDQLLAQGILIEDTKDGIRWRRK